MDLYNIPGDTGKDWRVNKFLEYAIGAPTVCHPTIIEYGRRANWGVSTILNAAFLHSLFYEELTAIAGTVRFDNDLKQAIDWYQEHKPHTNPDKRRVVSMTLYPDAINGWLDLTDGNPKEWIQSIQNRKALRKGLLKIKNIGGFSVDLFENCVYAAGFNLGLRYPDWKKTPQLAEGMCLLCYKDERANEIHSGAYVTDDDVKWMDKRFEKLCERMEKRYPNNPPEVWYTKICSFTNLFHGTRYGGFHHDRQLQNLYWHIKNEPYDNKIWDRIWKVRKSLWKPHMLGEENDWNGIRKERTKLWINKGLTGVEENSITPKLSQRLLVNIRGCNGSGKSTIPMSMMDDPDMYTIEKPYKGKRKKILTVFPTYKWVALGTYFNKTGGLDVFPNNELTQKALWYALKKFPEYDIIMEGVISSTIKSTYINLFHDVEEKYPDTKIVVMNFVPPLEVCLNRIQKRNGGKPIKEEAVRNKWKIVNRNVQAFKDEGFVSIKVDTSKISKGNMLLTFEEKIEKYKGGL